MLLKHGVGFDVNHLNKEGRTPMQVHIEKVIDQNIDLIRKPILKTLVQSGARINFKMISSSINPSFWPFEVLP